MKVALLPALLLKLKITPFSSSCHDGLSVSHKKGLYLRRVPPSPIIMDEGKGALTEIAATNQTEL